MSEVLEVQLEGLRRELTGYCYRMLGSGFDAEDAVQETLLRAWKGGFDEARGSLRTWVYRIATNVCLDMLRGARRRARSMDLGPTVPAGPELGAPLPEDAWVLPVPDARVLSGAADPAVLVAEREMIGLAFVAALQRLPGRQRAVLILREVLAWRAAEVADLLGMSVPAVNSAVQRARATLAEAELSTDEPLRPLDPAQRELLDRYVAAFERYDVTALVALLAEDATMSMPPFTWWLQGRENLHRALVGADGACAGSRLLPTVANGRAAFGQYMPDGTGGHRAFGLQVIEIRDGQISGMTTYLGEPRLFPLFDLPMSLP